MANSEMHVGAVLDGSFEDLDHDLFGRGESIGILAVTMSGHHKRSMAKRIENRRVNVIFVANRGSVPEFFCSGVDRLPNRTLCISLA